MSRNYRFRNRLSEDFKENSGYNFTGRRRPRKNHPERFNSSEVKYTDERLPKEGEYIEITPEDSRTYWPYTAVFVGDAFYFLDAEESEDGYPDIYVKYYITLESIDRDQVFKWKYCMPGRNAAEIFYTCRSILWARKKNEMNDAEMYTVARDVINDFVDDLMEGNIDLSNATELTPKDLTKDSIY
jgi:hypothetical protein